MLESNYLKRVIQRYGVSVNITDGNGSKTVKAFMYPLRAGYRLYLSTKLDDLDIYSYKYYLYMGPEDVPIEDKTLIERDGWVYEIISSEKVETKTVSYTWAVLKQIHKITTEVV